MRNAISYCAMRVGDLRIAELRRRHPVQLAQRVEELRAGCRAVKPCGFERYSTGSPTERNFTPWYRLGRKPLPHRRS